MLIRQAFSLLRQNPFFSTVSIIGTAVSIAFVMVVYMVYDIQTANIPPESHRDRMVYSSYGYSYRKADHSNANTGMSYQAACRVFGDLPGAELVTYMSYTTMEYCGASPEKGQRCQNRRVDLNFWRLYDIRFVAGRPFDQQEFDACADVVVIAERLAREAFGSAEEALGKSYFVDFYPKRVVGVTEDVSSLFTFAYGEVWLPYYTQDPAWGSEGLRGGFEAMVLCKPGVSPVEMKSQIENSLDSLNASLTEYELKLPDLSTYTERQFFRDDFLNPMVTCIMLGLILLIVPAINVSGLISSQMSRRLSELAVRKAYGASRSTLVWQLLLENLLLAFIGALLGFLLSCLLLWLGKDWMLAGGYTEGNFEVSIWLFLRPAVFITVLGVCLLFNLLSVFIPAWNATHRPIAEVLSGE
ncbi:ABC transporter permease [Bacteroides stercorirosoris]|jgi:putative ABC transport system permease protein|uniref:ABC transporter permease n=1 Tax=Bacteroides stercorirosoris TaxID=871324 RepID=A0A413GWT3_9BACE|nr:ABC transporter permease [Bacteroides stercorirosoris]RGX75585.1 ABC transporter permease [Bacteroides stercorirosoris]